MAVSRSWLQSGRRDLVAAATSVMMSYVLSVVRRELVAVPHEVTSGLLRDRKAIAPLSGMRKSAPPHGEEEHQRSDYGHGPCHERGVRSSGATGRKCLRHQERNLDGLPLIPHHNAIISQCLAKTRVLPDLSNRIVLNACL